MFSPSVARGNSASALEFLQQSADVFFVLCTLSDVISRGVVWGGDFTSGGNLRGGRGGDGGGSVSGGGEGR